MVGLPACSIHGGDGPARDAVLPDVSRRAALDYGRRGRGGARVGRAVGPAGRAAVAARPGCGDGTDTHSTSVLLGRGRPAGVETESSLPRAARADADGVDVTVAGVCPSADRAGCERCDVARGPGG